MTKADDILEARYDVLFCEKYDILLQSSARGIPIYDKNDKNSTQET